MSNCSDKRDMRFIQVERGLDSGMPISQWCKLNKVAKSTFYYWLKIYRNQNTGKQHSNGDWIEITRQEIKEAKALAVRSEYKAETIDSDMTCAQNTTCADPRLAIQVNLNGVGILVPPGCDDATIKSVFSAAAAL